MIARFNRVLARAGVPALLALATMAASPPAIAVEFGTASVMSAQGQRLKVVIPYDPAPGERVSVLQFQVVTSRAPTGSFSPDPAAFTISQPADQHMIVLQSNELVVADRIELVLGVATRPDSAVRYELRIPR